MPRNSTGTYTLPELAFVPGTTIESAPVNSDFSDIATALTQSLATTGVSTMTGPIKIFAGTAAAPGLAFADDLGTGWYLSGTDQVSMVVAGVTAQVTRANRSIDFTNGIRLGNVSGLDDDHLSWYEEGNFTPVLAFGGASVGITYSEQTGVFTRIGNVVFINIFLTITSNGSSTGDATISGLPFTASGVFVWPLSGAGVINLDTLSTNIAGKVLSGTDDIRLEYYDINADDDTPLTENNINDTASIILSGFYRV